MRGNREDTEQWREGRDIERYSELGTEEGREEGRKTDMEKERN